MKPLLPLFFCLLFLQSSAHSREDSLSYSERGIQNLIVFSKMYGALRYFYPSKKITKIDWEHFLVAAVPEIAKARSDEELIKTLNAFCGSKDVFVSFEKVSSNQEASGSGKFRYWEHHGFGTASGLNLKGFWGFLYKLFGPYHSKIVSGKKENLHPIPDTFYNYRLTDAITLHTRNAIYKKEKPAREYQSLVKIYKSKKNNRNFDTENTDIRAATAVYFVTALQHFFPYPEFVSHSWEELLAHTLEKAFSDSSNQQYLYSLRELFSELNDGHASVRFSGDSNKFKPPLSFVLIDSSIVINHCEQCDSLGVEIGDVLLKVDGENALQVLKREEGRNSASTAWDKTYSALSLSFLCGRENSTVHLELRGENETVKSLSLQRTHSYRFSEPVDKTIPAATHLDSSIVYIDLTKANYKLAIKTLSRISEEKGVILDMRGYPEQSPFFLSKLSKVEIMESQKWLVPIFKFPFQQQMEYDTSNWRIKRAKKTIPESCKVVFLTNYKAVSASETLMSIVKYYKVGTVIGETTAGTNGNIVGADFNGTFKFIFTGMKVLNQDGSQFHGIGVVPDIEVKPTIEGIREGRDEVLEYAIEYIKSNR